MSCYFYLVDKEKKFLVGTGNHVNKELFEEDYEVYCKVKHFINDEVGDNIFELDAVKLKDLSVENLSNFIKCKEVVESLSGIQTRWLALDYRWRMEDKDVEIITENELDNLEYKGYKII